MEEKPSQPVKLFYCYAREDQSLRDELHKYLAVLRRAGLITIWYDGEIIPGTSWEKEIKAHLDAADVILLLISPDFLASDYCYSIELKRALERHERGEARVIPIILRPVPDWQGTPFGKLQALPEDAKPVTTWQNMDAAFVNVVEGIRQIVEEVLKIQQVAQLVEHADTSVKTRNTTQLAPAGQKEVSKRFNPTPTTPTVWQKIKRKDFPSTWHVLKVPSDYLVTRSINDIISTAMGGAFLGFIGVGLCHWIFLSTLSSSQVSLMFISVIVTSAIVAGLFESDSTLKSTACTLVLMPDGFVDFSYQGEARHIVSYRAVEDIRFDSTKGILVVTMTPLSLEVKIKNFNESPRLIAQRVKSAYASFKASISLP